MTYYLQHMNCAVELVEERSLEFSISMIVGLVTFEDLVKPFEKKSPETIHRAKVVNKLHNMNCIVMVWLNMICPEYLTHRCQLQI